MGRDWFHFFIGTGAIVSYHDAHNKGTGTQTRPASRADVLGAHQPYRSGSVSVFVAFAPRKERRTATGVSVASERATTLAFEVAP
jgi:hypothetical protein